jgi:hypothetical protein
MNRFAMKQILGELPTGVASAFADMGIAEEEISAAIKRHKQKQHELFDSFLLLMPTVVLKTNGNQTLYRFHCRELLERIANDEDTRPGTKAEVVSAISEMSMRGPLVSEWAALYGKLFLEFFPKEAKKIFAGETRWIHGHWPTQLDEMLRECRRKLADENRVSKPRKGAKHGRTGKRQTVPGAGQERRVAAR